MPGEPACASGVFTTTVEVYENCFVEGGVAACHPIAEGVYVNRDFAYPVDPRPASKHLTLPVLWRNTGTASKVHIHIIRNLAPTLTNRARGGIS